MPSTRGPCATGDGIELGVHAGAEAVQLAQVHFSPVAIVDPSAPDAPCKLEVPLDLCAAGAVLLDSSGRRFVDELAPCAKVAEAMLALPSRTATLLVDAPAVQAAGLANVLRSYEERGLVRRALGLDAVARTLGVDPLVLETEIEAYAVAQAWGVDPLGKTAFPTRLELSAEPGREAFLMSVTPALRGTLGGLRIDEDARVLAARGGPIVGLFAAGEVCGGVHGADCLPGNAVLECLVFGRTAGRTAALAARAAVAFDRATDDGER